MSQDNMVRHPTHYQSKNGIEVWDVIENFTDGLTGREAFDAGCLIKYACRWHKKDGIRDLEKIIEYANHLIEGRKSQDNETHKPAHFYGPKIEEEQEFESERFMFGDITFETREEAEEILIHMKTLIRIDEFASIDNFYGLIGKSSTVDKYRRYGWFNLDKSEIIRTADGYAIIFPKPTYFK